MKRKLTWIVICLAIVLLALYEYNYNFSSYEVGKVESIIVRKGQKFELFIPEIPSTGFINYLDSSSGFKNISYDSSALAYNFTFWRKVAGNGARRKFYFHANKEGVDTIILYREAKNLSTHFKTRSGFIVIVKVK